MPGSTKLPAWGTIIFGLLMGIIFPFYAAFFVDYKPGLKWFFVAGCLMAGLTVGLVNLFLYRIFISRRLVEIIDNADRMASGDLSESVKVPDRIRDSFDKFTISFSELNKNLRRLVADIRKNAELVDGTSKDVNHMLELSRNVQQESDRIADTVNHNLSSQERAIEEIRETLSNMHISMQRVEKEMEGLSRRSTENAQQTVSGVDIMSDARNRMEEIRSSVDEALSILQSHLEHTRKIDELSSSITKLSDETNMLALNASIEAARAGEQGRGFSVVAEGVARLAEASREAAKNIGDLVNISVAELERITLAMDKSSRVVLSGVEGMNNAGDIFHGISDEVKEISGELLSVSANLTDLAGSGTMILQSIDLIRDLSKDIGGSSSQMGSLIGEQSEHIKILSEFSFELNHRTNELLSEVGTYSID